MRVTRKLLNYHFWVNCSFKQSTSEVVFLGGGGGGGGELELRLKYSFKCALNLDRL